MSYQEDFFKALLEGRVVLQKLGNQAFLHTKQGMVEGCVFHAGDVQVVVIPEITK